MSDFVTSADGNAIAYEVRGAGEPTIVLVHGWCCDRTFWRAPMDALAPSYQLVALDLAGHGESQRLRRHWTMAAYGADVAAVVLRATTRPCVLVGHSMGADVVVEAASRLPGRVRGLIWVDQYTQLSTFRSPAEVAARLKSFSEDFPNATREFVRGLFSKHAAFELVDRVSRQMAAAPEDIALASLEATWNHAPSVPRLLDELRLPVIAMNAPGDPHGPASLSDHGIQVLELPDAGHFPMLERPAVFTDLLRQAVERLGNDAKAERNRGRAGSEGPGGGSPPGPAGVN